MHKYYYILGCFVFTLFFGCDSTVDPGNERKVNPNITFLDDGPFMGTWINDTVITTIWPLKYLFINDSLMKIKEDSLISEEEGIRYISSNNKGDKIVYVLSQYIEVSIGALVERNLPQHSFRILVDDTMNVSSAVYLSNGVDLISYCYGNSTMPAGYYKVSGQTGNIELLFSFKSNRGEGEVVNGFDVSSDDNIIYIPLVYYDRPPLLMKLTVDTKKQDTLPIVFTDNTNRNCLWIRLNTDGSKCLYSVYPGSVFTWTAFGGSELGVIDMKNYSIKPLDSNPFTSTDIEVIMIYPEWSRDERKIDYGAARVIQGHVGEFSLFGLKDF